MFCPNCGNDCGNANFCPNCGHNLKAMSEPSAIESVEDHKSKVIPPIGKYISAVGYIEIKQDSLIIHKKIVLKRREIEREIAYSDIINLSYKKASGLGVGYISVREEKDQLIPMPKSMDAATDETTLSFGSGENGTFYAIYEFLKNFVDINDVEPDTEIPVTAIARANDKKTCEKANKSSNYRPRSKFDVINEKKAELDKSGQVYCPKCLSTSISANKKGFGIGKAVVGAAAFGGIGLAAGNVSAKKVICTCLKCGYQWKAGKR